jgi:hypothetical protein
MSLIGTGLALALSAAAPATAMAAMSTRTKRIAPRSFVLGSANCKAGPLRKGCLRAHRRRETGERVRALAAVSPSQAAQTPSPPAPGHLWTSWGADKPVGPGRCSQSRSADLSHESAKRGVGPRPGHSRAPPQTPTVELSARASPVKSQDRRGREDRPAAEGGPPTPAAQFLPPPGRSSSSAQ